MKQKHDRPYDEYPIGTKAFATGGGYWIKNNMGWKWCTGVTFPRPGGDVSGYVELPMKSLKWVVIRFSNRISTYWLSTSQGQ